MEVFGAKIAFLVIVVFWILPDFSASSVDACSCYSFHGNSSSRQVGRQHCKDKDGYLVSIETIEELDFIKKQLQNETTKNGSNEWWIGLEKKNGEWKWLGNHTEQPLEEILMNMLSKENEEKTFVTIIYYSSNASLFFNAVTNDTIAGWICEYKKNNCNNDKEGIVCLVHDPSASTTLTTTINTYTATNKPSTTAWITTTTKISTTTTTRLTTSSTVAANTVTSTTITTAPSSKTFTATTKTSKIVTDEPKTTAKMTPKVARLTSLAPTTATTTAATTRKPFFIGFLTTTSPVHECLSDPYLVVAITVSVVGGVTVLFFIGLFLFVACRKNCSKPRKPVEKIEMEEGEYENHL